MIIPQTHLFVNISLVFLCQKNVFFAEFSDKEKLLKKQNVNQSFLSQDEHSFSFPDSIASSSVPDFKSLEFFICPQFFHL